MSIVNQMSAETPPLKLCDEPFVDFLGFREEMQHGEIQYFMDFRDSHIGNPMIGTFHGGILASRIGMAWMILCLAGAVAVGYVGIAYFQAHPDIPSAAIVAKNPETVFMELTKILFNPWVAGVVLAAILAAVMSTLSCQLLVCSSTLTEDLYKSFLRKKASQNELVWVGRLMVLAISVLAIILAFNPESKVLGLAAYAWAGFGAAFGPLILLSVFWKRMTLNGALIGIIVGAVTVIVWKNTMAHTGLYEIVPGFCAFFHQHHCGQLNGQSA